MAKSKAKDSTGITKAIAADPLQGPEVNEVDGGPIFHADEEEGEDNE